VKSLDCGSLLPLWFRSLLRAKTVPASWRRKAAASCRSPRWHLPPSGVGFFAQIAVRDPLAIISNFRPETDWPMPKTLKSNAAVAPVSYEYLSDAQFRQLAQSACLFVHPWLKFLN
jgi:hypothetical protein